MTTTTDLKDIGFRELQITADLLTAYCKSPPDFLGSGVHLMMNTHSGYVFLTDEDFNVAMMNGDRLEQFHSCPECGAEASPRTFRTDHAVNATLRTWPPDAIQHGAKPL
ncbi:hypothetical protein AUC68_01065 [Methyloceanibacter methanicus]|uniref:Uncharacterized protein n=1 Tax=Methyloceanibacter methanicus TaxID=1774968 RepID=A0A1E3W379_9HYPH|nr:hypothetical protein [Methyloceanibacter methanicus]ODS00269.1 hypothetical protein AUC68_01065 [Methyloceanibacter methanicus]